MAVVILFRYIQREMVPAFVLSLAVLTSLLVTFQSLRLIDLLINRGLSLVSVGKIFLYTLPAFLVLTIPMAVLIASISAFSRLSSDNEDIALKATGIGHLAISRPVIVASLVVFAVTLPLSISAKPWGGRSMKSLAADIAQREAFVALDEGVFNDTVENLVIYVESMPTHHELRGILIADSRDPDQPRVVIAKRGIMAQDAEHRALRLLLEDGTVEISRDVNGVYREVRFLTYELRLDLDTTLKRIIVNPTDQLSIRDLRRKIRETGDQDGRYARLLTQAYKNYSFPVATVIFGICGIPLGLFSRRSGRLGGFAVGLGVIVIFHLFSMIGDFSVGARWVPPAVGALIPLAALALLSWGLWSAHLRDTRVQELLTRLVRRRRPAGTEGRR